MPSLTGRISHTKDKFGGPFTTEQVEDVKIVLRILLILTVACIGGGLFETLTIYYDTEVLDHLSNFNEKSILYCSSDTVIVCIKYFLMNSFDSLYLSILIFIPIHEFIIYPLFWKFITIRINSFMKFIVGLFFIALYYFSLMVIEAVGYHYAIQDSICFLSRKKRLLSLDFKWYCISQFIGGIGSFYIICVIIEFICSQAPFAMKGVIFGFTYFIFGVFTLLTSLLLLPVSLTVENWPPVPYGCGVWFYLSVSIVFLILTTLCIILYKKVYKMRRRDEDLHKRYIFAINYYSHYVQFNEEIGNQSD